MGKKYREPTLYRDKECPHCGLYFTPRGLNGHLRFRHSSDKEMSRFEMEKFKLLGNIHTDEGLKSAHKMFLIEYLTKGVDS